MRIPLVVFSALAAAAVADDALVVASALQPLAEERSGWVLYISTDFNSIMGGQTQTIEKQVRRRARWLWRRQWKRLGNCMHCERILLQLPLLQGAQLDINSIKIQMASISY